MAEKPHPFLHRVSVVLAWAVVLAGLAWNLYGIFTGGCLATPTDPGRTPETRCGFAGFQSLFVALLLVAPSAVAARAIAAHRTIAAWLALLAYAMLSLGLMLSFGPHLAVGVPLLALAVALHTWSRRRASGEPPTERAAANRS